MSDLTAQMNKSLSDYKAARVLVVGDIMLDRYLWGKVRRISPEAPVPVVKQKRATETLGGAGNVAFNLAALGCQVTVVGICGDDSTAQALKELLKNRGIDDRLIVDPSRPTITKTRIMAHKQQILRLDEEDVQELSDGIREQVRQKALAAVEDHQVVILSDYGKGLLTGQAFTQELIAMARDHDRQVLVDPKGTQWERYQGATCITPNTAELEMVAGAPLEDNEALLVASARQIKKRLGLDWLLVTRGGQGMCLLGPERQPLLIAARAREVYDVSGAGDTVIATLAAVLATGMDFSEAARIANLAAGIVVGKLGTQPILSSELATALLYDSQQGHYPYAAAKMTALDAALAKVAEWKAAGTTIVFTNGCFDLLHPGHISLLYQARALGDRLVVGLNTDASIKRLKGSGRPILSQQDRAAMLSALECVDLVVHFEEDTPVKLIQTIKPHILVKGSDYKVEEVVGREIVEAYGGSVKLVELIEGYSTTQITQKVISASNQTQSK